METVHALAPGWRMQVQVSQVLQVSDSVLQVYYRLEDAWSLAQEFLVNPTQDSLMFTLEGVPNIKIVRPEGSSLDWRFQLDDGSWGTLQHDGPRAIPADGPLATQMKKDAEAKLMQRNRSLGTIEDLV